MKTNHSVYSAYLSLAVLFITTAAFAAPEWKPTTIGWNGLQSNLTPKQVAMVLQPTVGAPLIITKARNGVFETWSYDNGASVVFVRGVLDYWAAPRVVKSAAPTLPLQNRALMAVNQASLSVRTDKRG